MKWKKNMQPLDMSKFSDILLQDYEGNLKPMSEPYFKATQIAPGTWQVLSDGDYTYVIEGDDEAIVIDSGSGAGNIREFCQSLVPGKAVYRLFNTHNHFDHTCNNFLFDVVYMSEECYEGRCHPFGEFVGMDIPDDYPVVFLKDGDVINLKGRPIEVYHIGEHCMGSLQFLDRRERILFCGDELNDHFFDSRISVEHSYRNLRRWASFRDAYDTLCAGNGIADAKVIDTYVKIAEYILSGHENEGQEYYHPFEDPIATIDSYEGKPVYIRRTPHMSKSPDRLIAAGMERFLEWNHGRGCFCFGRKATADGIFDRQIEMDGCRFCYFLNRIWDK